MMQLAGNNTLVECEACQNQIEVYQNELEYTAYTSKRGRHLERHHVFSVEFICDECANNIFFSLTGSEYPLGTFNYAEIELVGAEDLSAEGFGLEIEMVLS